MKLFQWALAGSIVSLLITAPVQAFGPRQAMSPAPWAQGIASACMPCSAKCDKCAKAGTTPGQSVGACKQECASAGNPSVNATCGIRQRC